MKKFIKNNIKFIIGIIIGIILSGTTVYAATVLFNAEDVEFDNTNTSLTSTNVKDALDELYTKSTTKKCAKGYYYTSMGSYYECRKNIVVAKLRGFGQISIFNTAFNSAALPDMMVLNGSPIPVAYEVYADQPSNILEMRWNNLNNNLSMMFKDCTNITELDLSSLDISNVTSMSYMFDGATSLTSLDLSGWDTSNVTYMTDMFKNTNLLTTIKLDCTKAANLKAEAESAGKTVICS